MADHAPMDRRSLLTLIGTVAGSAVMYQAMTAMGYAAESGFAGPIKLQGDPKGASVLILGAGLAGMTAAYELRKAGYKVQVLEYNDRPGGRNWSLHGGDTYTELGGATQHVQFDKGLYINPGPWRLPHHHRAILHYCKLLNVPLEPFMQVNYTAYVQSTKRLRRQAAALPRSAGGFQRPCRRVARQGHEPEQARSAGHEGRQGNPARRRCGTGARSTRITNTRKA